MLFHISHHPGIGKFEPRTPRDGGTPVVWAVDGARLRNYLLPRDCPRVTFYAGAETTPRDREKYLGSSDAVVAVESGWYDRILAGRLYCYHLPSDTFERIDECAGYWVSRVSVTPGHVELIDEVIPAILARGVELRLLPNLWHLHDAVASSSLQFSMIRMRNALPPPAK